MMLRRTAPLGVRQRLATILFRVSDTVNVYRVDRSRSLLYFPKDACGRFGFELLFCTNGFPALPARAVHLVGGFRCFADALAPDSPVTAYRLSCLGNSHGTAPLAVSFYRARELARKQSRSRTLPGWVPAPLLGQAGLSGHLGNRSDGCRGDHLRSESCVLCLDRATPIALNVGPSRLPFLRRMALPVASGPSSSDCLPHRTVR